MAEKKKKETSNVNEKDKEMQKESDSKLSEEGLLKRIEQDFKRVAKKAVNATVATISASAVAIIALMIVAIMIFNIIASILAALFGSLSGTIDRNSNVSPSVQEPGSKYVWNVQDLNALSGDMYLQNLYRHAWLVTNLKEITGSSMYTTTAMGIPVFENGNAYFSTTWDKNLEYKYSIADYASGMTARNVDSEGNDKTQFQGIYQHYMWITNSTDSANFVSTKINNHLTRYKTTLDALWGDMPRSNPLKTDLVDTPRKGYIDAYAGGDVMKFNYNISALLLCVLGDYAQTDVIATSGDWRGHNYGDAYKKALTAYSLSDTDEVHAYVRSAIFYLQNAGGFWGAIGEEDVATWQLSREAIMDYMVFCYVNYKDITVNPTLDITNLNNPDFKKAAMGDANAVFAGSSKYEHYTLKAPVSNSVLYQDGKQLKVSLTQAWQIHNEQVGKTKYNDIFKQLSETNTNNNGIRQAMYAVSVGPTMAAVGSLRLDRVFEKLGKGWVLDPKTGYICNPKSTNSENNGGTVSSGHIDYGMTFEQGMVKNVYGTPYTASKVRDNAWFAQIDTNEWSDPMDTNKSGVLQGINVTSRYGYRNWDKGDWHGGMDLVYVNHKWANELALSGKEQGCIANYPIYAMHDGIITFVRENAGRDTGRCLTYSVTYFRNGKSVTRYITYMHLSSINSEIVQAYNNGNTIKVKKGQKLGTMGGSGTSVVSYAAHLHLQLGVCAYPNAKNGLLDIETELPFVTLYPGYLDAGGGYLMQKPATDVTENTRDPQIAKFGK